MDKIKFKGLEYPVRTFIVKENDGAETQRNISVGSLSDALGDEKEDWGSVANNLDDQIYYYVEDKVINLSPEEICEYHLDMAVEFVEEIFGYME